MPELKRIIDYQTSETNEFSGTKIMVERIYNSVEWLTFDDFKQEINNQLGYESEY